MTEPEPVESLGDLDLAAAVLRELVHRTGAQRASALVDRGPDLPPAVVETGLLAPVHATVGAQVRRLEHDAPLDVALPDLPPMRQLPPMEVDPEQGTVAGPLGGLEHLGRAVRDLAAVVGGRTAVAAEFETMTPDTSLGLVARDGEPVVVQLGDAQFELQV